MKLYRASRSPAPLRAWKGAMAERCYHRPERPRPAPRGGAGRARRDSGSAGSETSGRGRTPGGGRAGPPRSPGRAKRRSTRRRRGCFIASGLRARPGTCYATPMPDSHSLLLFVGAGLLLNLTPGPDLLYILGRSMSQGRAAGVISAIGIGAAARPRARRGARAVGALLALPRAYDVVRLAGAAYPVVLGAEGAPLHGGDAGGEGARAAVTAAHLPPGRASRTC